MFDMVRWLGLILAPADQAWLWWPLGLGLHVSVGVLAAVFYAYFFWSMLTVRPALQGLAFGLAGALVSILAAAPLLKAMQSPGPLLEVEVLALWRLLSWREAVGLLLGHSVFGLTLGAIYVRPVGYPAAQRRIPRFAAPESARHRPATPRTEHQGFLFATGIECSYPTLEHGRWRLDQMQSTGHYTRWAEDFALAAELGVTHLRYGPPLHEILIGPERYDWSFTDTVLPALRDVGLTPIIDLCHFGLPSWLGDFQNPEVPEALPVYAKAFARRYPWVRLYTPVNEMSVCAKFSALQGLWNEQRRDETSYVTAVRHLARANALMCQAILSERPDAVLVNSESSEFFQACCPDPEIQQKAAFENQRRFLPLDLFFGREVHEDMRRHLLAHGMPPEEYAWFMSRKAPPNAILGVDYYDWNEKLIDSSGAPRALGELFGWHVIASQYWERYRRPMMHTETNKLDARAGPRWLWRQWHNVMLLQSSGVPIVGFTWYSLTDQVDWDIAMREALGNVSPVGLFDLNRQPRPVAQAYRHLIESFREAPGLRDCQPLRELLAA